ncbi:hypothetical protein EVAR_10908_1 [Eumeta japonica]|uniref:Uncharacterized protein n=1 Tax=Eumeta variegata TaxID=151549 RepID=A0A4C1U601_EUMVA|nr:hypothetical protein EVAR_10908_1 [Eumeta japonica]
MKRLMDVSEAREIRKDRTMWKSSLFLPIWEIGVECLDEDIQTYIQHLIALRDDFKFRFEDILAMEILPWIINPFDETEVENVILQERPGPYPERAPRAPPPPSRTQFFSYPERITKIIAADVILPFVYRRRRGASTVSLLFVPNKPQPERARRAAGGRGAPGDAPPPNL